MAFVPVSSKATWFDCVPVHHVNKDRWRRVTSRSVRFRSEFCRKSNFTGLSPRFLNKNVAEAPSVLKNNTDDTSEFLAKAQLDDSDEPLNANQTDDIDVENFDDPNLDGKTCSGDFLHSPSLAEYAERKAAGEVSSDSSSAPAWLDCWALSVGERKGFEMKNQYSSVGILIENNFCDFIPAEGCQEAYENASLQEISLMKAKAVHDNTGFPCISETSDMSIDPPESGSRINKSLQQGYYTRNIDEEADAMIDRVRPISDENRVVHFNSAVVYYDGEHEITTFKSVHVAMVFAVASKSIIAVAGALDDMYIELAKKFGFTMGSPHAGTPYDEIQKRGSAEKVLVGAILLRDRILREGKVLGDSIIKVSSFVNHKVDTDLMAMCGEELAERLRSTMPNKVLTVESTGLVAAFPTAKHLGVPLVFARKSRPITVSDSYQTTYRSATKGTTNDLIVSCEYLDPGDRVVIIDDFLAGGSTAEALFRLAKMAHAKVVGVGVLIEKFSDGGRTFLSGYDVPVESLAKVSVEKGTGRIIVQEEEPWVSPLSKMDDKKVREKARYAQAEYYSQTGEEPVRVDESLTEHSELTRVRGEENASTNVNGIEDDDDDDGDGDDDDDDDDDGEVDIIRWDDEDPFDEMEEDSLNKLEDELIRNRGKR